MQRYPDGHGGTYGSAIDLSAPSHGGFDPEAPQHLAEVGVTGYVAVGHTADAQDPAAPIYMNPADTAFSAGVTEGRCVGCITRPFIGRAGAGTMLLLEHQAGCPVLGRLAAKATGR
ncbi:MAG: hypothetical protein M3Y33_06795 [Actinomycetota bacterium]|nr:hypothetical protein [Actinomycetota bacterium]